MCGITQSITRSENMMENNNQTDIFLPKFKIYLVIIFHHVFASGHPTYY